MKDKIYSEKKNKIIINAFQRWHFKFTVGSISISYEISIVVFFYWMKLFIFIPFEWFNLIKILQLIIRKRILNWLGNSNIDKSLCVLF